MKFSLILSAGFRTAREHPGRRSHALNQLAIATILATATRHTWQALRCDRALVIYRTLSILLQVAGWLAFLACLYDRSFKIGNAATDISPGVRSVQLSLSGATINGHYGGHST